MEYEVPAGNERAGDPEYEEGGDPVCWAHLVCPDCGAIIAEGHRTGCEASQAGTEEVPGPAQSGFHE